MQFSKVLGLATAAAFVAMAFAGSSTAFAEADKEIVLCEELVVLSGLCPEKKYFEQGSEISGLAKAPKIVLGGVGTVECEDGLINGLLGTEMGPSLTVTVTEIVFGKLPEPTLGEGCSVCTKGVHAALPVGARFEVEALDVFSFKLENVTFTLLGCPFGITCVYTTGEFKAPIDRDAMEHNDWPNKTKDVVLINRTLTKAAGSNALCPANGEWKGDYVQVLAHRHADGGTRLFYLALEQL